MASPPAWLYDVAGARDRDEAMARLSASIKDELIITKQTRRDQQAAALARLQEDAQEVALIQQRGGSAAALAAAARNGSLLMPPQQSVAKSPEQSSYWKSRGLQYTDLLYAEGMRGKAERERWRHEAKHMLEEQQLFDCTFSPQLNPNSKSIVSNAPLRGGPDTLGGAGPRRDRRAEAAASRC